MRIVIILIFTINTFYLTGKSLSYRQKNDFILLYIIETCNSVYYPPTKCLDKLDHYQCVCGQGQLWNGYSCVGMK